MAKKSGTKKGLRKKPAAKRAGARKRSAKASKGSRKTAGARASRANARRKQPTVPSRARKLKNRKATAAPRKAAARATSRTRRGTGLEETLAQMPEAGRTKRGPTSPLPTRRSTGTPAGAGTTKSPRLERARRQLREIEEGVPTPPSSLDLDREPSAARSGRQRLQEAQADHTETSPVMTGGDVDADWKDAYSVGDEAPGGDNPTPDQDRVDDIGKALGVTYEDNEELKAADKIADRDKHRWELDPASSEDYTDRD
jgi:Family of unknown function (DUF6335)